MLFNSKMHSSISLLTNFLSKVVKATVKIDNDEILLDISSVAMAKYVKPVATNVEKLPTTDVALVITLPLSITTKNVAAYLSVYLL